jgi:hypothetical protein
MKKIFILAFFIFAMCSFASAQSPREVLDKVKEIKLLDATRNDVQRILVDYELDDPDYEEYYDDFSNEVADIEVSYSTGKCEEEEEEEDDDDDDVDVAKIWNVAEWKVTKIIITLNEDFTPADFGFKLSEFKKQKVYPDDEDSDYAVYYNKNSGIAFVLRDSVQKIIIYPPKSSNSMLCDSKKAKKFSSAEGWFGMGDALLGCTLINPPAYVADLILSAKEIIADNSGKGKDKNRSGQVNKISVKTVAVDPDNDVLTYNYEVSGGKIIGQGANVVWDLTGVAPGTYTITAGVDDGMGVQNPKTETVVVRKNPKD